MKRNTTRLFSGLTIILCLIFAFALSVSAQTGLSEDQVKIGETVNVSLDVPSGARVSAWSCTPYGALSFSATTNTGTTYKTVATAVKPGEITVRATVKYADNTTSTVTVGTLLTVLEDGIYTVGNDYADDYYSQSGAFYLRSQITYPTSGGLFVAQHSQNNFGDITNKIYNYWYIEHQGSGQYTIRSVADENKALTYSGSTFSLSTIGSNVTTAAKWYIKGENIIPVSATTKCLILSSSAPEGTYHTDGNAYTYFNIHVNGIGGIAIENWSFEKENISGVIFKKNNSEEFKTTFTKSYHIDTDTVNFSELGYSIKTYHYANCPTPTFEWFSSNSSVATINKTTGKLTIKNVGETTITLRAWFSPNTYYEEVTYEIVVIFNESTYFLYNSETNLYAGIQNATLSNGNEIEQQLFDGENKQKWIFEHIGSNIYTIKASNSSSYYLGVKNDSASSGAEVVLRTGNITNGMKWRIEEGKWGYKVVSCLNSSLVLGVYSDSSENGVKLVLNTYQNDLNYKDEWYIVYKVISCVNYYDSTFENNASLKQKITEANAFANFVYAKYFHLGVHMDGSANYYSTIADDCSCGKNEPCSMACGPNSTCNYLHHKNIYQIAHQLYNEQREDDHIYVLWTDRSLGTYCYNGVHLNALGVVINNWPVIHIMSLIGDASTCMGYNLVHELSHVLNMEEQYDDNGHDIVNGTRCVMEAYEKDYVVEFYQSVKEGTVRPFCNSCEVIMKNNTQNVNIQGG